LSILRVAVSRGEPIDPLGRAQILNTVVFSLVLLTG